MTLPDFEPTSLIEPEASTPISGANVSDATDAGLPEVGQSDSGLLDADLPNPRTSGQVAARTSGNIEARTSGNIEAREPRRLGL